MLKISQKWQRKAEKNMKALMHTRRINLGVEGDREEVVVRGRVAQQQALKPEWKRCTSAKEAMRRRIAGRVHQNPKMWSDDQAAVAVATLAVDVSLEALGEIRTKGQPMTYHRQAVAAQLKKKRERLLRRVLASKRCSVAAKLRHRIHEECKFVPA